MALNIPNVRLNAKGISHIPLHNRDINFTERSLFIPKMTIHQQNTILYNSLTLLFLNTDNNCFPFYNASNFWKNPYCSTGYTNTPSTLTTNKDNALTANGFVANCSSVAGITTYNPNVTTDADFTSFVPGNINNKIGNMTNNNVLRHNYNNSIYNRVRSKNYNGISFNSDSTSIPTKPSGFPYGCLAIGGKNDDRGYSIIQTTDGGYVVAGSTESLGAGGKDVYVIKLNGAGNLQWTRTIGGESDDIGNSIIQTTDGGYALAGTTRSFGSGSDDVYVVKLDGSGNIQWTRTIGGGENYDEGYSIIQTTDGGYAVAGFTSSFGAGGSDVYVVKLDGSGGVNVGSCGNVASNLGKGGTGGSVSLVNSSTSSGGTVSSGGVAGSGGNVFVCVPLSVENNIIRGESLLHRVDDDGTLQVFAPDMSEVKVTVKDVLGRIMAEKNIKGEGWHAVCRLSESGIYLMEWRGKERQWGSKTIPYVR
jgi:hypothetical protein